MATKHQQAVEAFKFLNNYCNNGNCRNCTFSILGDCPFYILDEESIQKITDEAKRLGDDNDDGSTID